MSDVVSVVEFAAGPDVKIVEPAHGFQPRCSLPLDDFFALLAEHEAAEHKGGRYICRPMGGDGSRSDANALKWSMLALDLDDLTPKTFEALKEWSAKTGLDCQLTSTFSHSPDAPRVRL